MPRPRGGSEVGMEEGRLLARELELEALGLADDLLAGERRSVFRGSGLEADGVRPYVAGDDVRTVDWRVTARTGKLHVRELIEERGTDVQLVLDRSASLHRCASGRPGRVALQVTAALAVAATRAGHRVGLLQVTERSEGHVPAGRGRHQLRWILGALAGLRPERSGTALAPGLRGLLSTLGGRTLVAVVSDFRVPPGGRLALASAMDAAAGRHDLLPVRVRTPGPENLPPVGLVSLADPETGTLMTVDTSDPRVRAELRAAAEEAEAWWASLCAGLAAPPLDVDPFEPLVPQLRSGLRARWAGRAA